jgi:hypothetical protein
VWISERIRETRWLAQEARAAAYDIDDDAVRDATVQLANDLETFAARLASALTMNLHRADDTPRGVPGCGNS